MPHPFCNAPGLQQRPYGKRNAVIAYRQVLSPAVGGQDLESPADEVRTSSNWRGKTVLSGRWQQCHRPFHFSDQPTSRRGAGDGPCRLVQNRFCSSQPSSDSERFRSVPRTRGSQCADYGAASQPASIRQRREPLMPTSLPDRAAPAAAHSKRESFLLPLLVLVIIASTWTVSIQWLPNSDSASEIPVSDSSVLWGP